MAQQGQNVMRRYVGSRVDMLTTVKSFYPLRQSTGTVKLSDDKDSYKIFYTQNIDCVLSNSNSRLESFFPNSKSLCFH